MQNIVVVGAGQAGLIAATLIKAQFSKFNITVVASSELGTIGVGEGSTEHWREYEKLVTVIVSFKQKIILLLLKTIVLV